MEIFLLWSRPVHRGIVGSYSSLEGIFLKREHADEVARQKKDEFRKYWVVPANTEDEAEEFENGK